MESFSNSYPFELAGAIYTDRTPPRGAFRRVWIRYTVTNVTTNPIHSTVPQPDYRLDDRFYTHTPLEFTLLTEFHTCRNPRDVMNRYVDGYLRTTSFPVMAITESGNDKPIPPYGCIHSIKLTEMKGLCFWLVVLPDFVKTVRFES